MTVLERDGALHFRPRRGRVVPLVVAVILFVLFGAVAVLMVQQGQWQVGDASMLVGLAVLISGFLLRYAGIRADATPASLRVRNIFVTRELPWDDIVAVHFPDGDPWVSVELVDTEVLAVMAIQRTDGPVSREEASRLAGYWQAHLTAR